MSAVDLVRSLCVVLATGIIAQVAATLVFYFKALRGERRRQEVHRGVLAQHVLLVGVCFIYFTGAATYEMIIRLGDDITWRVVLNPFMLTLSNVAVWLITTTSYRRYSSGRMRDVDVGAGHA